MKSLNNNKKETQTFSMFGTFQEHTIIKQAFWRFKCVCTSVKPLIVTFNMVESSYSFQSFVKISVYCNAKNHFIIKSSYLFQSFMKIPELMRYIATLKSFRRNTNILLILKILIKKTCLYFYKPTDDLLFKQRNTVYWTYQ